MWTSSLNLRIPKFSRKILWLERGFWGTWWSTGKLWSEHFFHVGGQYKDGKCPQSQFWLEMKGPARMAEGERGGGIYV